MRLARVLLAVLLLSSLVAAEKVLYPGESYWGTVSVRCVEDVVADRDYSDGKVTYIYLLHAVYSYPSAEKIFSKHQELESVRAGTVYTCRFNLPITRKMSGKYVVLCSLIKITGSVDINTGTWKFGWKNVGGDATVFRVKEIPRPPEPNIIARIIQSLISFFKSMLGVR